MQLAVQDTPISGLQVVTRGLLIDGRGSFGRLFCADDLGAAGFNTPVAQINRSTTSGMGTIRGLHYQFGEAAEVKLVSCTGGSIFDVAVDLRPTSPTFLKWHGVCLSAENGLALLVPRGCAHGFQVLTEKVEMIYIHSHPYVASAEAGLYALDPRLSISWPLPPGLISDRDLNLPTLKVDFAGVDV